MFGALLGLVALAHTAPALILVATFLVVLAWRTWSEVRPVAAAIRRIAVVGAMAFVVASPFLVPLALRYRFRIRNEDPSSWVWPDLAPAAALDFAWRFAFRWPILVVLVGPVAWWFERRRRSGVHAAALITWTLISVLGLVVAVWSSSGLPIAGRIPHVVPSYHFLRYVTAALAVWFGIGAAALIRALTAALPGRTRLTVPVIATALAGVMILVSLPTWRTRFELRESRRHALDLASSLGDLSVSRWIARATDRNDVILYDIDAGQALMVGPVAGRTTVAVAPVFSNPYVDWEPRNTAAASMSAALATCTSTQPVDLFAQYGVTHLVTPVGGPLATAAATSPCPALTLVYQDRYAAVFAVSAASLR